MDGKVCILLSYYKGEKFIYEQVNSILSQDYSGEIEIVIRDDGPDDSTLSMIGEHNSPLGRSIHIFTGENIGPQRSFLELIQKAPDADFYFFSDQDDVWKSGKIRAAVEKMIDTNCPFLWCSDYSLVDADLNMLKENTVVLVPRTFHFLYAQMFNTFPGCVMGFNKELFLILKEMNLNNCMMHDSFAFATAIATGKVFYDNTSYILHRIHGENVVGTGFRKSTPLKWIRDKYRLLINREAYDLTEFGTKLLNTGRVNTECVEDVKLLSEYRKNLRNTLRLLFHRDVRKKPDPESLSIHCKIFFRLF